MGNFARSRATTLGSSRRQAVVRSAVSREGSRTSGATGTRTRPTRTSLESTRRGRTAQSGVSGRPIADTEALQGLAQLVTEMGAVDSRATREEQRSRSICRAWLFVLVDSALILPVDRLVMRRRHQRGREPADYPRDSQRLARPPHTDGPDSPRWRCSVGATGPTLAASRRCEKPRARGTTTFTTTR